MNKDGALADRYEEIRRTFFARHEGVPMWGYVVLRTKGMVAWARSWREHGEGGVKYMPHGPSISTASHLPPCSEDVVRVLTGMVLAVQKEAMP